MLALARPAVTRVGSSRRSSHNVPLTQPARSQHLGSWLRWARLQAQAQDASATASFSRSSPELYISMRMSEPPMNSPFTYT